MKQELIINYYSVNFCDFCETWNTDETDITDDTSGALRHGQKGFLLVFVGKGLGFVDLLLLLHAGECNTEKEKT